MSLKSTHRSSLEDVSVREVNPGGTPPTKVGGDVTLVAWTRNRIVILVGSDFDH